MLHGPIGVLQGPTRMLQGPGPTVAQGEFLISEYCEAEIWESGELAKHVARADPTRSAFFP